MTPPLASRLSAPQEENEGGEAPRSPLMLPHAQSAQPAALTEDQRRRIARNRLLARQRRQASVVEEIQAQRNALRLVQERLVAARGRVILNCPFAEKDRAKELGARWDVDLRKWFIPQGMPIDDFARWLPKGEEEKFSIALREKEALLCSSQALAQNWVVCSACCLKMDKAWDVCPMCELARTYIEELKTQVARRLHKLLPSLSDIAREEVAGVVVHVLIRLPPKTNGESCPSFSASVPRAVLTELEALWCGTVAELSLGSRRIKELGSRCCETLQAGVLEPDLEESAAEVCKALVGIWQDAGLRSSAELLSRVHLEPGERTTCKEDKARVLLRVAECYLDLNEAHTACRLGQEAIAECSTLPLEAAYLCLQARICEKQHKFDAAWRHYHNLSKLHLDKETGLPCVKAVLCADNDPPNVERGLHALTKASVCAILALKDPEQRSSTLGVLLEDERSSRTAPHNLMRKIYAGEEVKEDEICKLEEIMQLHCKEASRPGGVALRRYVQEHNLIALGRRRGQVKDWNTARGFGFISRKGAADLFCHVSDITDGDMLLQGEMVEYKEHLDGRRGPRAVAVTGGSWGDGLPTTRKRKLRDEPPESPHPHRAPPGGQGRGFWVLLADFSEHCDRRKSFGCFSCHGCGNSWPSAHAFPQFMQGCKSCEAMSKPCCLWYNHPEAGKDKMCTAVLAGEHHDQSRCEACRRLGDCRTASRPPPAPVLPFPSPPPPLPRPACDSGLDHVNHLHRDTAMEIERGGKQTHGSHCDEGRHATDEKEACKRVRAMEALQAAFRSPLNGKTVQVFVRPPSFLSGSAIARVCVFPI